MPTILAFTAPQVQKLARLTKRMLTYWEETGVYGASYVNDSPHRAYRRIYSFSDVVSLRTLSMLRREHHVSLEELRKTGRYLRQFSETPWTRQFWVVERTVLFLQEGTGELVDRKGQRSYIDVSRVWAEVEAETSDWNRRDPRDVGHVARHRHVQHNQWVVKGTRVPTSAVWRFHEAGYDAEAIVRQYPNLVPEDVDAALRHEQEQRTLVA